MCWCVMEQSKILDDWDGGRGVEEDGDKYEGYNDCVEDGSLGWRGRPGIGFGGR